jgi:proline-specific peptidase
MFVKIDDVRLFFDVEGAKVVPDGSKMKEKPTVLLLHGGPGLDHTSFKPAFSAISDIAQIIYLDQRGHGRSDRSSPEYWTLARWADDVRQFCDALGIERPVVFGTSFGGYVAMEYAIRHRDHPAKIILASTSLRGTAIPERRRNILNAFERIGGPEAREVIRRALDERTPQAFVEYLRVCGPLYTRSRPDPEALKRYIRNDEIVPYFERSDGEGAIFDLSDRIGGVRCPILLIGGELDPITPIAEQEVIANALPPHLVRFERFADCGHGIFRDNPERMFQVIREFLFSP